MTKEHEGEARIVEANRAQLRFVSLDLERLLPEDHQARAVWAFVEHLDLREFLALIRSREGSAGRPAIDPRILMGLWMLATLDGVGAAREIERLCHEHLAYQWLCGGVNVNHHTLSDFRNLSSDLLQGVLTQTVSVLLDQGLVEMNRVAQDGMKVRASAGASSFRTKARLKKLKELVREQVETLSKEIESDAGAGTRRQQQARQREAERREKKIERALKEMQGAEKKKKSKNGKKKTEARTSTTDPESRVMKMADGGFRPAYNIHLASTASSRVVLAVEVNNEGTDTKTMVPLSEQIEERFKKKPTEWLADGGCSSLENIDRMSERGCEVFSPLRPRRNKKNDLSQPRPTDSAAIREWRVRMNSDDGKNIYKERGSIAEWVNAQFRAQGLTRLLVRGTRKVLSNVLIHAITHNMTRSWALA
jgi:transposase